MNTSKTSKTVKAISKTFNREKFIESIKGIKFKSMAQAKRITGLSYLGAINASTKIAKGEKIDLFTYVMYLSPANTVKQNFNICPKATAECKAGCLVTSGRVIMDTDNTIINARIKRTLLYIYNRPFFMDWLKREIESAKKKAAKNKKFFACRLNGTSDLNFYAYRYNNGKGLTEIFNDVQFYEYTKVFAYIANNKYSNLHYTFSYTGRNKAEVKKAIDKGINIAVIFKSFLPAEFMGKTVINGDYTDYRPADKKGCIIGLTWKKIKDSAVNDLIKNSCFVIQN